jgi:hypothetical protein
MGICIQFLWPTRISSTMKTKNWNWNNGLRESWYQRSVPYGARLQVQEMAQFQKVIDICAGGRHFYASLFVF